MMILLLLLLLLFLLLLLLLSMYYFPTDRNVGHTHKVLDVGNRAEPLPLLRLPWRKRWR